MKVFPEFLFLLSAVIIECFFYFKIIALSVELWGGMILFCEALCVTFCLYEHRYTNSMTD